MKGFSRRRGNAEVKYQASGWVPHAEAPALPEAGKMLNMKAESSGQSGMEDCQK